MESNGAGRARGPVDDAAIESDRAQLSALASTLEDLSRRITQTAGRYEGTARDDVAHGLYEVERSLVVASRKLEKVMRALR